MKNATVSMKMNHQLLGLGLPEFLYTYNRHEDGFPVYDAIYPLTADGIRDTVGVKLPANEVELLVGMVTQAAAAATVLLVDGVETPGILIFNIDMDVPEMIEHELVHCRQLASGRLTYENGPHGELLLIWEGKTYTQQLLADINANVMAEAITYGHPQQDAFVIAQMQLPWEEEAYELTRHVHPYLSEVADRIRSGKATLGTQIVRGAIYNIKWYTNAAIAKLRKVA